MKMTKINIKEMEIFHKILRVEFFNREKFFNRNEICFSTRLSNLPTALSTKSLILRE